MARLRDGFPTTITFQLNGTVKFWETRVKPPGFDGGGPNNTTTMRNVTRETTQPKKLYKTTPMTATGQYDPALTVEIQAMINQLQKIYVNNADGSVEWNWGWIDKWERNECAPGEPPTCTFTCEMSSQDASFNEVGPNYTAP